MATRYRQCKTFSPQAFRPSKCKHCFKETGDHDKKCTSTKVPLRRAPGAKKPPTGLLKRGSSVELLKLKFETTDNTATSAKNTLKTSDKIVNEADSATKQPQEIPEIEITEATYIAPDAEESTTATTDTSKTDIVENQKEESVDTKDVPEESKDEDGAENAQDVTHDEAPEIPSAPLPLDETAGSINASHFADQNSEIENSAFDASSMITDSAIINMSPIPRATCLADISNADISAGSLTTVKSPRITRKSTAKRKSSRMESESILVTRKQLGPVKKLRQDTWV